jgi:hypothetical protein
MPLLGVDLRSTHSGRKLLYEEGAKHRSQAQKRLLHGAADRAIEAPRLPYVASHRQLSSTPAIISGTSTSLLLLGRQLQEFAPSKINSPALGGTATDRASSAMRLPTSGVPAPGALHRRRTRDTCKVRTGGTQEARAAGKALRAMRAPNSGESPLHRHQLKALRQTQ